MGNVPDYFYDQSAVIPFRRREGCLEVLMITSRRKKRWVIPKGVKEPELSAADSATKEALEEAGIRGGVSSQPLGSYRYKKWGGVCEVQVFAMAVDTVLTDWEESYRDRQWVSLEEARRRVREKELKMILRSLPERLETLSF
jgi:phosphohistidine phosphatase